MARSAARNLPRIDTVPGNLLASATQDAGPKRLRILDRAARAFIAEGYEGATLDDIAIDSGVSKLTLYRLFGDKAQLFATVITTTVSQMTAPLKKRLEEDRPIEETLTEFAECYCRRMIAPIAGGRPFFEMARLLISNVRNHPTAAQECFLIFQRDLVDPLRGYFEGKIAAGTVIEEDPTFLASHFLRTLFFTNFIAFEPDAAPSAEELGALARRKVRLFLGGCRVS